MPHYYTCVVCGAEASCQPSKAYRAKTCSIECNAKYRRRRVTITCIQCGRDHEVVPSQADRPYCSWECRNEGYRTGISPPDPEKKRVKDRRFKVKQKLREKGFDGDPGDLVVEEWLEILEAFDGICAYCGERPEQLTMDHVIPASKGGRHTANNVVPACFPCNQSKRDHLIRPTYGPSDYLDGLVEAVLR